jgi:beta-galactosidase
MKAFTMILLLAAPVAIFSGCAADSIKPAIDPAGWKFSLSDSPLASQSDYDDSGWQTVEVPHDWSILGPYDRKNPCGGQGGYLPTGIGWYRKNFDIPAVEPDSQYLIMFDGVFMNSQVWVNGKNVGGRPYGYVSFYLDITDELKPGVNFLAVRVDNEKAPNARWYPGCGIYGDVTLIAKKKISVDQWGVFVTTPEVSGRRATVAVETTLNNATALDRDAVLETAVLDAQNREVARVSRKVSIPAGKQVVVKPSLPVANPSLWSPDSPYLYKLTSRIVVDRKVMHAEETRFGIRSLKFDSRQGFFINGVSTKLKGVCEHSDGGLVGSAIPEKVLRRRLRILKEMGCNAIRVSHNPRRPIFYDLCDEMGIMVMDEIFDGWHAKTSHDYGKHHFKTWWKTDVRDWVKRDRNHPCVIMYSIGNETGIYDKYDISGEIRKYDTTRPTTGGSLLYGVDVAGFNAPGGTPGILEKFHAENPDKPLVLTEVPHTLQTRGFYRTLTWWRALGIARNAFPPYNDKQIFFDQHMRYSSSYDNCGVRITARQCWKRTKSTPWIMGEFRWTGFDYLGEASFGGGKWPARIWNFGIIDLCGFPKDHYYFYQSQWTDKPMVHILPHWTHRGMDGVVIPVVAYSNCDQVELFLDGESLGRKPPRDLLDFVWRVPYRPGTLKAVGYRDNKAVATKVVKTAQNPTAIKLTSDNVNMKPATRDISHLTTTIEDAEGNFVPWAGNRIEYKTDGPVKLLGFDNGDPLDVTSHRKTHRKTFNGLSLGIFQSTDSSGPVVITAAGILGRTLFPNSTKVAVDIDQIALRGRIDDALFGITYSINDSEPVEYSGPFELTESAVIKATITKNGEPFVNLRGDFTKGPLPKITDPRLVTGEDKSETFGGPRDKEVAGLWILKATKRGSRAATKAAERTFLFDRTGSVYTLDGEKKILYGYWWYDHPDDASEDLADSGRGQLFMYVTDQMCSVRLESQKPGKLVIKSRFRTWYFERKQ